MVGLASVWVADVVGEERQESLGGRSALVLEGLRDKIDTSSRDQLRGGPMSAQAIHPCHEDTDYCGGCLTTNGPSSLGSTDVR